MALLRIMEWTAIRIREPEWIIVSCGFKRAHNALFGISKYDINITRIIWSSRTDLAFSIPFQPRRRDWPRDWRPEATRRWRHYHGRHEFVSEIANDSLPELWSFRWVHRLLIISFIISELWEIFLEMTPRLVKKWRSPQTERQILLFIELGK